MGTINVIFAAPGRTGSSPSRVMSVARLLAEDSSSGLKRAKMDIQPILGFSDEDKIGIIQPHDDTLVVTLRIEGYDVKRILVDQGSTVEIMYLDLYKGLNLRSDDLMAYNSPLVSFEGKTVIPKRQIRLPIQIDLEIVEVDFIVVDSYSPYIAIMAGLGSTPWEPFLPHSTRRWSTRPMAKSKRSWGANQWLGNAWWLPYYTDQTWSYRLLPKGTYSNQKIRRRPMMNQLRRPNAKI